jgi:hypothetical protein
MHTLCPPEDERHFDSINEYVDELRTGLQLAFQEATHHNLAAASRQKAWYDRKARKADFQIGSSVFIRRVDPIEGLTPKLLPRWMGPFLVCLVMGDEVLVQPMRQRGKTKWVHVNDCKPFGPRSEAVAENWPEPFGTDEKEEVTLGDVESGSPTPVSGQHDATDDEEVEERSDGAGYDLRPRSWVNYRC